ncbi:protein translocase subunit SecD [Amphritea pacifica]|uniref:Protein translocase subunit SecD n=1 Tax=Amphritea pacifica TaxID=2811233 RepID=A0ABS2W4A6_9GAMM|nr:protein translocase subunit SecD [Amphritea pacifica]MBN0986552.1 protein translocase subunit SecD [Amphritea pacifica]MBN1006123.1 protein translocase subunit SecD [Amphritea pacifica]
MLNKYPLWKNALIVLVLLVCGLYAAPNLFPDDYAVQLSGTRESNVVNQPLLDQMTEVLQQANINVKGEELTEQGGLIRFKDSRTQLEAKEVISRTLGDKYIVALNLAPTTPEWLRSIGAGPMKLGLDLRGGVHFLLEVDMVSAVAQRLDVYVSEIKTKLRTEKLRYRSVEHREDGSLELKFSAADVRDQAATLLRKDYSEFLINTEDRDDAFYLSITLVESKVREIEDYAIKQNLTTLRNRVNELGVAEPLVQRQGRNRIVVQLPGIQDAAAAKRIIGKTANLEFRLEAKTDAPRVTTETYEFRNENREATLEKDVIITGSSVSNAQSSFDENGQPQVNITLDAKGGQLMNRTTRNAIKRRMAVLFVEHKSRTLSETVDGEQVTKRIPYVEKKIISLATIQSILGNQFRITGLDSATESSELALLLRAGALAAPIYFVEERTVGPSLGEQNIELGMMSVQIGFALVLLFMLAYYRVFGLLANIALTLNLVMLLAVMSILSATLTLPGIAGIVLTVGMAVDANVLIFSRIREELKNGMPPQSAINAGFDRAFSTIFDANITTLLAAVILFAMGSGPVKGFAITLSVGILTSMFTAIMVTRMLVNLAYGGRTLKKLSI